MLVRKIGAFKAKTHLSQLLNRASHGESFAITKHGRVIAFLTPAPAQPTMATRDIIAHIRLLRKKIMDRGINMTLKEVNAFKKSGRR